MQILTPEHRAELRNQAGDCIGSTDKRRQQAPVDAGGAYLAELSAAMKAARLHFYLKMKRG